MKNIFKILASFIFATAYLLASASNLRQMVYLNGGLTQLKTMQGDSTNGQSAWWYQVDPPQISSDRYTYIWDNSSTATPNDDGVVKPTAVSSAGRWLRQGGFYSMIVNADWNATSGAEVIFNKPTIPAVQVNADWGSMSGISQILNRPSLATVATSGAYSDLTGAPSIPNAQIQSDWAQSSTGSADYIKNKPANRSQSSTTRSLNTIYQPSSSRDVFASYSVQITVTASITGGQNGDVILETASDSGFTANVQTVAIAGNGITYTLAIALQGVQPMTATVSGLIPAGYYARLRTVNNTGTPSFTYRAGQEILM